jgi:glycosyltransferase involved in cell wall biosynthesis
MKFSIITATLNSGEHLEECIGAILAQRPFEFEHIIVDGGSTDATVSIARRFPHLTVIERPGSSIYEAWNVGLDVASGDLMGVCNSDDFYAPNTFARVVEEAKSHPNAWLVSGKAIHFTRDAAGNNVVLAEYADKPSGELRFENLHLFGPSLNARFFTRNLVNRFGKFDTRFRLASDCSYMMEIALSRLPVVYVDEIFYYYRSHSRSSSLGGNTKNATISLEEKLRIGNEFINSSRLQPRELRHLRQAMAVQFVATIIECLSLKRWNDMMISLRCLRWFSIGEGIILWSNACTVIWGLIAKRSIHRSHFRTFVSLSCGRNGADSAPTSAIGGEPNRPNPGSASCDFDSRIVP